MYTIAIADDHPKTLLRWIDFCKKNNLIIVATAENGYELLNKLNALKQDPDILLLDINIPRIDGVAMAYFLSLYKPTIKIIALSGFAHEGIIHQMVAAGAKGFVTKGEAESILENAIQSVLNNEYYIDERINITIQSFQNNNDTGDEFLNQLTIRERLFVALSATDLSYQEIANLLYIELKTVHRYFERVSDKLQVHSRHSLTLLTLQTNLARIAHYK